MQLLTNLSNESRLDKTGNLLLLAKSCSSAFDDRYQHCRAILKRLHLTTELYQNWKKTVKLQMAQLDIAKCQIEKPSDTVEVSREKHPPRKSIFPFLIFLGIWWASGLVWTKYRRTESAMFVFDSTKCARWRVKVWLGSNATSLNGLIFESWSELPEVFVRNFRLIFL